MAAEVRKAKPSRIRKANFTHAERTALFEGICKWKNIISSIEKKENVVSKAAAYREITNKVNAVSAVLRSVKEVKKKWMDSKAFAVRWRRLRNAGETDRTKLYLPAQKQSEVKIVCDILFGKVTPFEVVERMKIKKASLTLNPVELLVKENQETDYALDLDKLYAERVTEPVSALVLDRYCPEFEQKVDIGETHVPTQFTHPANTVPIECAVKNLELDLQIVKSAVESKCDSVSSSSGDFEKYDKSLLMECETDIPAPSMKDEVGAEPSQSQDKYQQLALDDICFQPCSSSDSRSRSKRNRKQNFTEKEILLLLDGLEVHKSIIFCRSADKSMVRKKKVQAWRVIAEYVNKNANQIVQRTVKELRKKVMDMTFVTRQHARAILKGKKVSSTPWYFDRMRKLDTTMDLGILDIHEITASDQQNSFEKSESAPDTVGCDSKVGQMANDDASVTELNGSRLEGANKQKMIQQHLSRIAESKLHSYGIEAGAFILHNGHLHSFGSDCRALLAKSEETAGDPTERNPLGSSHIPSELNDIPIIVTKKETDTFEMDSVLDEHGDDYDESPDKDLAEQPTDAEDKTNRDAEGTQMTCDSEPDEEMSNPTPADEDYRPPRKRYRRTQRFCEICGATLADLRGLERHIECHLGVDRKRFQCEVCGEKFTSKDYVRQHQRKHTGELPFTCKYCKKGFSHLNYLKRHMKHHTGERCTCHFCGARFFERHGLNIHMRLHTGENPFACENCGLRFRRRESLKSHIIRHHMSEKPFNCEVCSQGFVKSSKLKEHMRIHTGEKPYVCQQCGRKFKRSDALRDHERNVHSAVN